MSVPQPGHPHLVLATTIFASLATIDGSVVHVGLPAIGRSLDAAGDRFGRRRMLCIGVAQFALVKAHSCGLPSATS